jgi:hypothetical protein
MISLLVTVLIVALVIAAVYWVMGMLPLPQPAKNIILVVLVVILLIWLISILIPYAGHSLR